MTTFPGWIITYTQLPFVLHIYEVSKFNEYLNKLNFCLILYDDYIGNVDPDE